MSEGLPSPAGAYPVPGGGASLELRSPPAEYAESATEYAVPAQLETPATLCSPYTPSLLAHFTYTLLPPHHRPFAAVTLCLVAVDGAYCSPFQHTYLGLSWVANPTLFVPCRRHPVPGGRGHRLLQSLSRCIPRTLFGSPPHSLSFPAGVTLCLVAVDGAYCGFFAAQDVPRSEAAEAVHRLEALGVEAAMLTGDGREVAKAVGQAIGLRAGHVHDSLLPRDKLDLVRL